MEISELKSLWAKYDLQLVEHTKVNKRILREMLIKRPLKTINWLKINGLYQLFAGIIIIALFFKTTKHRDPGVELYCGSFLLFALCFFSFFRSIKYFFMLKGVNMAGDLVRAKKQLIDIQKYKLSTAKYNLLITPFSILSVFLVLPIVLHIMPVLLLTLGFLTISIYKFKMIAKQFSKLNEQLNELEDLQ